ncbi:hypothetical protein V8F20_002826 [Naviculisporaceae sp. PSN 640]
MLPSIAKMASINLPSPEALETHSPSKIRREVYASFHPLFESEKRSGRPVNKSSVGRLVRFTESARCQELRSRLKHSRLVHLLRTMMDEGIFTSEERARREFRGSLRSTPLAGNAGNRHAPLSLGGSNEGLREGDDTEGTHNQLCQSSSASKPSKIITRVDKATNTAIDPSATTSELLEVSAHSLLFSAQLDILASVERILEETCFGFAQRYLPSVLLDNRYECSAAVELGVWAMILTEHREHLGATVCPTLQDASFPGLVEFMKSLRHTFVHRQLISAAYVFRLISSAADLANMLQDHTRAKLLREIRQKIESGYEYSQKVFRASQKDAVKELGEIKRAQEELAVREKKIVGQLNNEENEHKRNQGRQLRLILGDVIEEFIEEWDTQRAPAAGLTGGHRRSEEQVMRSVTSEGGEASRGNVSAEAEHQ